MLKHLVYVIFLILMKPAFAGVQINEIMADPSCSESYCEYVELYNNGTASINVTNWKISDNNEEDFLEGNSNDIIIAGNSFVMIVDSDSRVYSNFDVGDVTWIYVDDDKNLLKSMAYFLNEFNHTKLFQSPKECLEYICNYTAPSSNYTFLKSVVDDEKHGV